MTRARVQREEIAQIAQAEIAKVQMMNKVTAKLEALAVKERERKKVGEWSANCTPWLFTDFARRRRLRSKRRGSRNRRASHATVTLERWRSLKRLRLWRVQCCCFLQCYNVTMCRLRF